MKQKQFNFIPEPILNHKRRDGEFNFLKKRIKKPKSTYRVLKFFGAIVTIYTLITTCQLFFFINEQIITPTLPLYKTNNEGELTFIIKDTILGSFKIINNSNNHKEIEKEKKLIEMNIKSMIENTQSIKSIMILDDTIRSPSFVSLINPSLYNQVKLEVDKRIKKKYENIIISVANNKTYPFSFYSQLITKKIYQELTKKELIKLKNNQKNTFDKIFQ